MNNNKNHHGKWGAMLLPALATVNLCLILTLSTAFNLFGANFHQAQAAIIGKDDRTAITLKDAQAKEFAIKTPWVHYCANRSTTGILTRVKGSNSDYLLLSAHHLFNGNGKFDRYDSNKNGKIDKADKRCSLEDLMNATIAFNLVYLGSEHDKFGRTAEQHIFDGEPINLKDASNYYTTGEDVLIIKLKKQISEQIMPDTKQKRGYSKFLPVGEYAAKRLDGKSANIAFHADTHHTVMKNEGCNIRRFNKIVDPRISFKSNCDAQPGSSNSPVFINYNNEPAIWGLVIGGTQKNQPENTAVKNWVSIKTTEFLVKEYKLQTVKPEKSSAHNPLRSSKAIR